VAADPLTRAAAEADDAADPLDRLRDLVARREHEAFDPSPGRVT
jgi:hypothetical protein